MKILVFVLLFEWGMSVWKSWVGVYMVLRSNKDIREEYY